MDELTPLHPNYVKVVRLAALGSELAGAVIATGSVQVDQNLKEVQHRDGGIIAEILVREGDLVSADRTTLV
ncbi:MAG: hypothetical protein B7Z08_12670, partial [Sphingomonadales bacterium 32-68-7]